MLKQPSCDTWFCLGLEPLFAACSLPHSHCIRPHTIPGCTALPEFYHTQEQIPIKHQLSSLMGGNTALASAFYRTWYDAPSQQVLWSDQQVNAISWKSRHPTLINWADISYSESADTSWLGFHLPRDAFRDILLHVHCYQWYILRDNVLTCVPSSSKARMWVATLSRSQRSWEIITTDPAHRMM